MTQLGCRLSDIPSSFGWDGLSIFISQSPETSALNRAINPDYYICTSPLGLYKAITDLYDNVSWHRYEFACANSKKGRKPKQPKPYPTPWSSDTTERVVGKGAIPISQFDDWYYGTDETEDSTNTEQ